jgi:hypothetical protein
MMVQIAETFAAVLAEAPDPLVAVGRIGPKRPSGTSDLPAITVGVRADSKASVRSQPDPRGAWLSGSLPIEVWAASPNAAIELCRGIEARLRDRRERFRERGFGVFRTLSLEPVEELRPQPVNGSAFAASRLKLEVAFAFQAPSVEEVVEGGPIRQIDVSLNPPANERLTVS